MFLVKLLIIKNLTKWFANKFGQKGHID